MEKQKTKLIARSSAKAEYREMALGICEALWLKFLLYDMGLSLKSTYLAIL